MATAITEINGVPMGVETLMKPRITGRSGGVVRDYRTEEERIAPTHQPEPVK